MRDKCEVCGGLIQDNGWLWSDTSGGIHDVCIWCNDKLHQEYGGSRVFAPRPEKFKRAEKLHGEIVIDIKTKKGQ